MNGDEVQVFVYRHTYALDGYYLDVDGQEVALYLALCYGGRILTIKCLKMKTKESHL